MAILRRAHGAATAWTTSQPIPYSLSATAGDTPILYAFNTQPINGTITGWTLLASGGPGAGYYVAKFVKNTPWASGDAQPTVTATGGAGGVAFIEHWYTDAAGMVLDLLGLVATDTDTSSTAFSAASAALTSAAGDVLLQGVGIKTVSTMTGAPSSVTFTQAGATLGTLVGNFGTRLAGASPTNSLHYGTYHRPVTTGATGAMTSTATSGAGGGNAGGVVGFVRLREVPAATNTAPTADAGPDQTVDSFATVTLTGAASSDSDGTIASYAWSQVSGTAVALSGSGATRTFTAPANSAGTSLVFGLTVTDNLGATSTQDNMAVTVLPHVEWLMTAGGLVPIRNG